MGERYRIRAHAEIGTADWDAFVDASPEAWLWHRSALVAALALWPGQTDVSFAVVDREERIVAIMPLHRSRTTVARVVPVIRLQSLGGPACADGLDPGHRAEALALLRAELDTLMARENAVVCDVQVAPLTPSLFVPGRPPDNPLSETGFEDRATGTWMVDLDRSPEAIRKGYSTLTRRELRKAEAAGVRIREAEGGRDLETYYRLHLETYARTGARPHPLAYFQAIFETCRPANVARILFAERDGTVVAAQNTARYKQGAVYWTGASTTDKAGGENRLLFDAQIMAARAEGCLRYETGEAFPDTATAKERGLSQFKRSFGADLRPFFRGTIPTRSVPLRALWALRRVAPASAWVHR